MLSLPRLDPDIPLRLVPAAARQRGAHLARVLIQAGLINARTLPTRMDTDHIATCRAALAVLDIFEHDNVIAANRVKSIEFTRMLSEVAAHPRVRYFRHLGMIWAFDVADATPGFASRFHRAALAQDVFIRPIGHTVYVMPPYVTSANEMRGVADAALVCLDNPEI
jgi:adenosylmethionine-8-amino-7-oxononanoate aminotransferase